MTAHKAFAGISTAAGVVAMVPSPISGIATLVSLGAAGLAFAAAHVHDAEVKRVLHALASQGPRDQAAEDAADEASGHA